MFKFSSSLNYSPYNLDNKALILVIQLLSNRWRIAYTSNVQLQKKQLLLNSKQPTEKWTNHWKTFLFSPGNAPTVCFFIYVVVTWYLLFINTKSRSLNLSLPRPGLKSGCYSSSGRRRKALWFTSSRTRDIKMGDLKFLICDQKDKKPVSPKERTPLRQRISYCTGHIFNDLCSAVWFTYFIVYFNKVVGLSTTQTGLLFLIAQGADAVLTPFMGIGCDRLAIKRLARYGKRKSWHLFCTIFVAIAWPFIFSPCLACSNESPGWLPLAYYSVTVVIFHVGWAGVQIAHLSLIPEIAKRPGEIVELNAVR